MRTSSTRHRVPRTLASLALLTMALAGCLGSPTEPELEVFGQGPRVLFIGNSHTFYHDVPALVQALAASRGEQLAIAMVAAGGYDLRDHWDATSARSAIARGGWKHVVLQQGPSAQPASRELLLAMTRQFATEVRAVGATPAMYAVWPAQQQVGDFAAAIESYRLAAAEVDALLLPASTAWLEAWERDASLELYLDGVHGSAAGAYLAALVIYARLTGGSPLGLPSTVVTHRGYRIELPPATAALLQDAAVEALVTKVLPATR